MKKEKINQKKVLKDMPPEKRYFGIILEDIDSKMKLVLEGHLALDKRIDNLGGEMSDGFKRIDNLEQAMMGGFQRIDKNFQSVFEYLSRTDERLEHLENRLDKIEGRLDKIEGRLDKIEGRLDKIEQELQSIKLEIADLKHHLDKKADLERLLFLEKRVEKIEIVLVRYKNKT